MNYTDLKTEAVTFTSTAEIMDHKCKNCVNVAFDNKNYKDVCMAFTHKKDESTHPFCDVVRKYSKCKHYKEEGRKPKNSDFMNGIGLGAFLTFSIAMIWLLFK